MLLSAVSVFVVAQSSSGIPEGLMNNPVCLVWIWNMEYRHVKDYVVFHSLRGMQYKLLLRIVVI